MQRVCRQTEAAVQIPIQRTIHIQTVDNGGKKEIKHNFMLMQMFVFPLHFSSQNRASSHS